MTFILDIGGEGRHRAAWNLNPCRTKTLAPGRGQPIPRHIAGRADAIPLPDDSVDEVIVERTPLTVTALQEIDRVVAPGGRITLRHAMVPGIDPHATAKAMLAGQYRQSIIPMAGKRLQQCEFVDYPDSINSAMPSVDNKKTAIITD